jgi:hypothetical protein
MAAVDVAIIAPNLAYIFIAVSLLAISHERVRHPDECRNPALPKPRPPRL